jgi:hypothetical protein
MKASYVNIPFDSRNEPFYGKISGHSGGRMFVAPINISIEVPCSVSSAFAGPVDAAKEKLLEYLRREYLGIDPDSVVPISAERVVWNNGALGCPREGHMYTQALVPGFRIVFHTEFGSYSMHTDSAGRSVVSPDFPSHS